MSRTFSTARQNLTKWLGYSKDLLPTTWKGAVERYEVGGAVKVSFQNLFFDGAFAKRYNRKLGKLNLLRSCK